LSGVVPGSTPAMGMIGRALESVESFRPIDRIDEPLQRWLRRRLPDNRIVNFIRGSWLGHPLHPILVQVPIGAWLSSAILDAVPGQHTAARRLVLSGIISAVPAAIVGVVDARDLTPRPRRVAGVHAATNSTALACYITSYLLRRNGRIDTAKRWSLLGLTAVSIGGLLGGHMAYAQGAGVGRWQPELRHRISEETPATPAMAEETAEERWPVSSRR
jgi:uncharacterized membrane protein